MLKKDPEERLDIIKLEKELELIERKNIFEDTTPKKYIPVSKDIFDGKIL